MTRTRASLPAGGGIGSGRVSARAPAAPILAVALCSLSLAPLEVAAAPARGRPNVLFLLADDQRPDTIAALGNPAIRTPNLDRLVEEGFAFTNAYCMGSTVGAVCNPSRHMILSGMSLFRYDPARREGTFGDVLRKAGYETFHLSKQGNTAREYHKAFEHSSYLADLEERRSGHHGRRAAERTVEFLRSTWDRKRPFFAYVGFEGPHDPRVAAPEWLGLYEREKIPLPASFKPFHPIDNDWMKGRDEKLAPWPRTEEEIRRHLHEYYACISSIDHSVGRILRALEDIGELDDTLVIYSADHGLAIGSHGLFGKQNLYEHSTRAPLVFMGPGVPRGKSSALAYLFDVFPTVCDLAGVGVPPGLDGASLADVIRGQRGAARDAVFLAFMEGQRAVRKGDWKLIRYPKVGVNQLFDLAKDADEMVDLARLPEHAARVEELERVLESEQRHWDDTVPLRVENPARPEVDLEFFRG